MDELIKFKLMDAANDYTMNVRKGYPRVMDETDIYIKEAFEAGAKWYMDYTSKETRNNTPTNQKTDE